MARNYRIVSADGHLEIAPERWSGRVPAKWRDRAPRRVTLAHGGDGVIIENRQLYVLGLAITARPPQEHQLYGLKYEGNFGAGGPDQRIKEQEQDGVDAEVMFTSAGNGGFWRGIRSDDAYKSVIHAYNEFLAEEYCAYDRDRLLAMAIIPGDVGVDDSIAELEYCAKSGLKGVALNSFPSGKSYPTPEDDKFWQAALEMRMPLTVHVSLSAEGPVFKYDKDPMEVGFGADPVRVLTRFVGSVVQNAVQLVVAGVFDRFPDLRIYYAETMIGWIPYFYEQVDDIYERSRYWAERDFGLKPIERPISDYIRQHCYWGFLKDPFGMRHYDEVGADRAMWGSDFPHSAGNWPHSRQLIQEMFADVSEADRYKMLCGNAVEFFHLDQLAQPSDPLAAGEAIGSR